MRADELSCPVKYISQVQSFSESWWAVHITGAELQWELMSCRVRFSIYHRCRASVRADELYISQVQSFSELVSSVKYHMCWRWRASMSCHDYTTTLALAHIHQIYHNATNKQKSIKTLFNFWWAYKASAGIFPTLANTPPEKSHAYSTLTHMNCPCQFTRACSRINTF